MRFTLLIAFVFAVATSSISQTAQTITSQLNEINQALANRPCAAGNTPVVSHKAMNIFLADKTAYLFERGDLSFYTNYITFNTTEGRFAINHNFQQKTTGVDEPIKKLLSVGVYANVGNGLAAGLLDKQFENELVISVGYTWLSKVKTKLTSCSSTAINNQKHAMDALRAAIFHSLQVDINKKELDLNTALNALDSTDVPGQSLQAAKELMKSDFYKSLAEEYAGKFATQQAVALANYRHFKRISLGWTNVTANIPLVFPTYWVAPTLTTAFDQKKSYPLEITFKHTRLWESRKSGRVFLSFAGNLLFNNSKLGHGLDKTDLASYKSLGGTDTIRLASLKNDKAYIGSYQTFLTPSLKTRVVYFPGTSHLGVSFLIEQNFGSYNLLNARLGVPVILINKKKLPAVNVEFYCMFFDVNNKVAKPRQEGKKTMVGINLGMPFSRLMY